MKRKRTLNLAAHDEQELPTPNAQEISSHRRMSDEQLQQELGAALREVYDVLLSATQQSTTQDAGQEQSHLLHIELVNDLEH